MHSIYKVVAIAAIVGAVIGSVWAASDSGQPQPSAAYQTSNYDRSSAYYTNVNGNLVHRPVFAAQPPAGATAQCVDGAYSFSQHRRGTCNYRGGVKRWLQ